MKKKRISLNKNAAVLAAATLACFGMSQQAEAALTVTWEVSEVGSNLKITTTGSIDLTGLSGDEGFSDQQTIYGGTGVQSGIRLRQPNQYYTSGDIGSGFDPFPFAGSLHASTFAGDNFGVSTLADGTSGRVYWDISIGASPGIIAPDTTLIFNGQTIASTFGTALNSGPVTLFTHTNGDTIQIALVPESTTTALLGLGGIGLIMLRKRR